MEERIYLVMLHNIGISQKYLHIIFAEQQNYKEIYKNAITHDYLKGIGFKLKQREYILQKYNEIKKTDIEKKLKSRDVRIVIFGDKNYPESLINIANPPYLFYLRGKLDNSPKIAVVGSRKMTGYGKRIIEKIIPDVSKYFSIVSGGAAGVDSLSHKVCIENHNRTVCVIGTGICQDYPVDNKSLYDEIVLSDGAIISIFPIDEVGNPYNFPIRNEIVVGLSSGVFIVEAQERSGSLITARLALESGRDVFSCPGDIFCSSSVGCNALIQKGEAKLVSDSQHILEEYGIENKGKFEKTLHIQFSNETEKDIYNILLLENLNIDNLSKKLDVPIQTLSSKVSFMEISGLIFKNPQGKYSIR